MRSECHDLGIFDLNFEALQRRTTELLGVAQGVHVSEGWPSDNNAVQLVYQGAISVLTTAYGLDCPQHRALLELIRKDHPPGSADHLLVASAALQALQADLDAGLVGDLRARAASEVVADFIGLAREAMADSAPGSQNVAAVLAAAAFEDTIRRMGERFAGVTNRPGLPDILSKLKAAGVIEGPQISIAQSYLPFRNRALHAEWDQIDRSGIESCLGFVEQLLLKHFA